MFSSVLSVLFYIERYRLCANRLPLMRKPATDYAHGNPVALPFMRTVATDYARSPWNAALALAWPHPHLLPIMRRTAPPPSRLARLPNMRSTSDSATTVYAWTLPELTTSLTTDYA